MKILVTAGGTTEYIDDVRVLTNISTGKLGAEIGHRLMCADHQLTYVAPKLAERPAPYDFTGAYLPRDFVQVSDVASLMRAMEELVPKHDVVIHAMAVSDFGFKRDKAVKLKSNDPEAFIEYMRANIQVNPKVIAYVKKWNPKCKLVGFKFEVGMTNEKLIDLARQSIEKNGCDLVIANDKEEMNREKEHIAYSVSSEAVKRLIGKEAIAQELRDYVERLSEN